VSTESDDKKEQQQQRSKIKDQRSKTTTTTGLIKRARKCFSLAFKKVLHTPRKNKFLKNDVPAYPPEADDPDDDDEEALIAALLSFSFLFLASSSIFSSMSISSLLEDDDALIVPFEPILLRWNCAFFSREEEEEIKADDLAEQAAVKDEDANIVLPLCFLLRVLEAPCVIRNASARFVFCDFFFSSRERKAAFD